MKSNNKQTLMVWAIIVLFVLNVSTWITIVYHQVQASKMQNGNSITNAKPELNTEKFSGRYFRDQLNLSSEQMSKFREFNHPFRMKAREITFELAEKRKTMLLEMVAPKSDTTKLNVLSDSIGMLHSELKKISFKYYLNIKAMCSKEQQIKLEQLFSDMFSNDAPMTFPGRGMQAGMQHGRNVQ
jgi:hypothetical protein